MTDLTQLQSRVQALDSYVWDGEAMARKWMATRHPELGGLTPTDASQTESGARRVEDILSRLFYGLPV